MPPKNRCASTMAWNGRPWTTWMPALCAGVVAVLCYVNSLDGDFVHDDMVAVVGNPDVTGENRRHAASSSLSSLWMNDFWGATDGGSSKPQVVPAAHSAHFQVRMGALTSR
ncbi:hypothetical protein MRX96_051324 [Rhipicephalus microplus]